MSNRKICHLCGQPYMIKSRYIRHGIGKLRYTCLTHYHACDRCSRDIKTGELYWDDINYLYGADLTYRRYRYEYRLIQPWHYQSIMEKYAITPLQIQNTLGKAHYPSPTLPPDEYMERLHTLNFFPMIDLDRFFKTFAPFTDDHYYTFNCWPHQPKIDPYLEKERVFVTKCATPCPIAQNPKSHIPCSHCTIQYLKD